MSLKCMIDKWLHKGQISQEEYEAVMKKLDGHDKQVRAEVIEEIYNELLYVGSKFRSMLLNTSQESDLIEWVDLNGKLMAITTIKHMIQDKLKDQNNE